MTAPIFISHSSKDQKIARTICAALETRGLICWIASRDVGAGDNFQEAIVTAIRSANVMVLVFTDNANNSAEIKKELALASQNKLAVIPARAEDVVPTAALAYELATRQWINLFEDWESEIENLCARVRQILPPPPAPEPKPLEPVRSEPPLPCAAPGRTAPTALTRTMPLWLGLILATLGALRLTLSSIFLTTGPSWELTSYLLAADTLTVGVATIVAGLLIMPTARWASVTGFVICAFVLLHDLIWLGVLLSLGDLRSLGDVHTRALVLHFLPMVPCAIVCAVVLYRQFRHGNVWNA